MMTALAITSVLITAFIAIHISIFERTWAFIFLWGAGLIAGLSLGINLAQ